MSSRRVKSVAPAMLGRLALLGCFVPLGHFVPVNDVPESGDIIGATVLILEVISVFPDVQSKDGLSFDTSDSFAHQRAVLIGRRSDFEFAVIDHQPSPTRAEASDAGGSELFLECIKASEGRFDVCEQSSRRFATCIPTDDVPEEGVVPMPTAIVSDCSTLIVGDSC